jgi:hypothetical protein
MTGHTFTPLKPGSNRCRVCGGWSDASYHSRELWSDVDKEREAARLRAQAERMSQTLRTPKANISEAAGRIERDSPLFFGTGDNPPLF